MITWAVELQDKVTAPANAAGKAMGEAASKAQGLQAEMSTLHGAVGHASEGTKEMGFSVEGLAAAWETMGGVLAAEAVTEAFDAIIDKGKELIETAIEASERVTKLTEVFGALSGAGEEGGENAGKAIFQMTRDLAKQLPQSEATIQSWTRTLMAAGVTDMGKLQSSLKAVAGAEALVEGGGEKVRGILAKLNEASEKGTKIKFSMAQLAGTGVTEADLLKNLGMTPRTFELAKKNGQITGTAIADAMTKALEEKSRGPLEGQMNEVSTVIGKAKDALMHLFEGINIKPLVDGLRTFFSVFDAANPSGRVMQDMIVGTFDLIFKAAGKVFTVAKDLFLHLMIWSLQAAIFLKPIWQWVQNLIAAMGGWRAVISGVGAVIAGALVAGLITAIPVVVSFAISVIAATWPILAIIAGIFLLGVAIYNVVKHWEAIKAFFVNLATGAWEAAKGFVSGLVDGIRNGVGLVVEAVEHMGTSAWNAIKRVLHLGSPSKLMFEAGLNTSQGLAGGIEAGTDRVEAASSSMGKAAANGGSNFGSKNVTVNFGDIHIDASHAVTPQQMQEVLEEQFGSFANRISSMLGAAPDPA